MITFSLVAGSNELSNQLVFDFIEIEKVACFIHDFNTSEKSVSD